MKPSEFLKREKIIYYDNGYKIGLNPDVLVQEKIDKLDEQFIDKDKLIDIDAGTCFGLQVYKIQKIIDFFRKEGFNPYEWQKFEEEINRSRIV